MKYGEGLSSRTLQDFKYFADWLRRTIVQKEIHLRWLQWSLLIPIEAWTLLGAPPAQRFVLAAWVSNCILTPLQTAMTEPTLPASCCKHCSCVSDHLLLANRYCSHLATFSRWYFSCRMLVIWINVTVESRAWASERSSGCSCWRVALWGQTGTCL